LVIAVQQVLQNKALRTRLQAGVSDAARLYTWDRIATQTAEVFDHVLRTAPAGHAPHAS